jgi:hypothetical protein
VPDLLSTQGGNGVLSVTRRFTESGGFESTVRRPVSGALDSAASRRRSCHLQQHPCASIQQPLAVWCSSGATLVASGAASHCEDIGRTVSQCSAEALGGGCDVEGGGGGARSRASINSRMRFTLS